MANRYTDNSVSLSASELYCERDDRVLFERLNLTVKNGDLLQLAGPNGAGKTTLLRLLAGLNRDFDGDLLWHGEPLTQVFADYASQRLYLGHLAALKRALTPLENLRWLVSPWMSTESASVITDDDLWQALEDVELGGYEETPCNQLSAGQQRRVGLSRLAIVPAPLWILDEPFTALDVAGVAWLEARIQQHVARNGAVIITSHHALQNIPSLKRLDLGELALGGGLL
ncbi:MULTISPECIES: cytochrome c biogenesis heme-transporting ATPase CcmA [unclassified Oceanobacter]|jgi:heme exporter protein A|uniref:cytochrome c biogenesis heme-transporting ATPase CcmA n=1 Tax=unclassified Oceanobacter TaxID=2620260 RepID=UPI0026E27F61|nr:MULTISPECIES: cytochrome c biogenesis heme-transporting ATPase CcmA [unclassified Oceanobacter]MDO6682509.1 cytochrome c biogenesis heme-transporting ATPase CcmA [Oceanobacter sp. 5_MG-2023]MDP2506464.1 cytochrome c biogenesis heme-transporting ATPase CcmA [Oceanobacter sp. 3_MG-2023]